MDVKRCEVCGEPVEAEPGELELHDGSKLPAKVWQHGLFDDGRPHWKRVERILDPDKP